jgi:cytochrome c2
MQNYSHAMVRRFDRCTTCHQLMQRTLPGQPQDPAYIHERDLVVLLNPPEKVIEQTGDDDIKKLERTYGMRIAPQGLVKFDDVTVSLVLPKTPAARAEVETASSDPVLSEELRENVAKFSSAQTEAVNFKILPGLLVGDVIVEVEDAKADRGAKSVAKLLLDAVGTNKPVRLTVRRGLGNPYTTHPRLDLFAGDASPHPMGTFGCTVCHEGQGNATAFKWVSHMPNDGEDDPEQSKRWASEHGWFDNHHWIYPMWPKRFQESGCLKCHHEVVELEPSEKFPDPPAPKLTHGYHLIRKYGCYGCHDINGFDGPRKRVGPDLRTEPNFYAAALQIGHLMAERLTDLEQAQKAAQARFEELHDGESATINELKRKREAAANVKAELDRLNQHVAAASRALELAPQVASRSYDGATRTELYQLFTADAAIKNPAERAFDVDLHRTAAVLKDVEAPGALRKPGPTLRYVREKDDSVFLYDWIANPRNFRPDTRMPQFFGLHKHLEKEPKSLTKSHDLEPVEIHGLVKYLEHNSQEFVPLEKPEGIVDDPREQRVARGKMLFETRGCLACHEHHDFPKAKEYRGEDEIVQGPELSAIAQKFDAKRNPKGREWLYSWIKNPTRYNVRTLMPNLFLDPLEEKRPVLDANGEPVMDEDDKPRTNPVRTDPAADIVEYLLDPAHIAGAGLPTEPRSDTESQERHGQETGRNDHAVPSHEHKPWEPVQEAQEEVDPAHLKELVIEYLRDSFHESRLEEYYENGLPERLRPELKVAEQDLLVAPGEKLSDEQRLLYIGRKTVAKFGCYGCHDVPGFEDAKPIGTGLADWGRKDPSRLAFEHISHYLEHGHGHAAAHGADSDASTDREPISEHSGTVGSRVNPLDPQAKHPSAAPPDELPVYYERALSHGNRVGFIYQKLREPRSYDFEKTANKKYNDRLRMPEFPFNIEEREAVITFVLGLVAEPPTEKYVYKPSERDRTIIAGKQVLETFNCGGCHILDTERWKLSAPPEIFGDPSPPKTFPFALHSLDPSSVGKSATTDRRGMVEAELRGLPSQEASGENGALPVIRDPDDADYEAGEKTQPRLAKYEFALFQHASAVGGEIYQPGTKLPVPGANLARKYPTQGGYLTKYLSPVVYALERKTNPNAKGDQVLGWLPPPLMGEGKKVQTAWLYDFLMEPYTIRPATFLRMPKFNLSPDDTSKLVAYFAAKDNASYPYEFDRRRQADHLSSAQADYAKKAEEAGATENLDRLEASLKTVTNRTYCVQCHSVADFISDNTPRAQGPDLAQVYKRLRPDYVRRWIAYPTLTLPYTAMPENIKYDPMQKQDSDAWFHGTRTDQVDGLVDLLMNFDEYAKRQTEIAKLVPAAPKAEEGKPEEGAEAPAETGAR